MQLPLLVTAFWKMLGLPNEQLHTGYVFRRYNNLSDRRGDTA